MKIVLLVLLSILMTSCSTTDESESNSAQAAFEEAKSLEKDSLYEPAIRKYAEVKNKHPYSKYAISAELKIADLHFQRDAYAEARAAYQVFKDLHPTNKKIAYVTHQIALCYYHQLPSSIDRDLSLSTRAIVFFDEVIRNYPSSKYAKEALEKKKDLRKRLAEKELYIAEFYFIRDQNLSAMKRYEGIVNSFSDIKEYIPVALLGAGKSAARNGDKSAAREYLRKLINNHSNTSEAEQAREVVSKYGL